MRYIPSNLNARCVGWPLPGVEVKQDQASTLPIEAPAIPAKNTQALRMQACAMSLGSDRAPPRGASWTGRGLPVQSPDQDRRAMSPSPGTLLDKILKGLEQWSEPLLTIDSALPDAFCWASGQQNRSH